VHSSTTIKKSSVRILLAMDSSLLFKLWNIDVSQAYKQAAVDLQRKILTKPDTLNLGEDKLLQLI
jgi:hypothetical protein